MTTEIEALVEAEARLEQIREYLEAIRDEAAAIASRSRYGRNPCADVPVRPMSHNSVLPPPDERAGELLENYVPDWAKAEDT